MTYKKLDEMAAALEFIQLNEALRSGSLALDLGTNRSLQRLSSNADAALGSLFQLSAGTLEASSVTSTAGRSLLFQDMRVRTPSLQWLTQENVAATYLTPNLPVGSVLYVKVDVDMVNASKSLPPATVQTYSDFINTLNTDEDRDRIFVLGVGTPLGVHLANGKSIRTNNSLSNHMHTDAQYANQTNFNTLQDVVRENASLRLVGGGVLSWDTGTGTLSWTQDLFIEHPFATGSSRVVGPGSVVIPAENFVRVSMSRTPSGVVNLTPTVSVLGSVSLDASQNFFVIAIRKGDGRIYLADGTAMSDGESVRLGGVRTGVQWSYRAVGSGSQVLDLAAALGPSTSYRVGTGELMVYRNGVKALASTAHWEGAYPAGSLTGAISFGDDYVEEDSGDGTGSRIVWLADQVGAEVLRHPANTHDPRMSWPAADDRVEAFVGIQGKAPTISLPTEILGFDRVWAHSTSEIRTLGGSLLLGPDKYVHRSAPALSLEVTDMFGSEIAVANAWHYIYLGPGSAPGFPPDFRLSTTPPSFTAPADAGTHPSDWHWRFLTSVRVLTGLVFDSFAKTSHEVVMGGGLSLVSAFPPSVISNAWEVANLGPLLPATGVRVVRLRFTTTTDALVADGTKVSLSVRPLGFTGAQVLTAVKGSGSNDVDFEATVTLGTSDRIEVLVDDAVFISFADVRLLAYDEPRASAASDGSV